ncbi:MAG: hypothetical protein MUF59_10430 [Candidatus Krumholzibacteria bacterium]|jgi:hypothetical protein|nr:hypothetical protein [Candidatus Krumholzibacteria bacterium]
MKRIFAIMALAGCLVIAATGATFAGDEPGRAYGLRVGFGLDPDQFVVGIQTDLGSVYKNVHFVPSIDAGFGDNITSFGLNGDFKMFLPMPKSEAAIYVLAGPTAEFYSFDGETDTEVGLYLGGGVRMGFSDKGWYNLEARIGIGDIPEFRLLLGILFGGR